MNHFLSNNVFYFHHMTYNTSYVCSGFYLDKDYALWRAKNLKVAEFNKKIKVDVKECPLRIHPNICSFDHLDKVDSGAKKYDSDLCNSIPDIIRIVDGNGIAAKTI